MRTELSFRKASREFTIRGSRSDPMEVFGNTLLGAGEQAGVFDVVVTAPGYEIWTQAQVRVREDECHVIPVQLDADLVQVEALRPTPLSAHPTGSPWPPAEPGSTRRTSLQPAGART